jgi:hypothetical protein
MRRGLHNLRAWSLRDCMGVTDRAAVSLRSWPGLCYIGRSPPFLSRSAWRLISFVLQTFARAVRRPLPLSRFSTGGARNLLRQRPSARPSLPFLPVLRTRRQRSSTCSSPCPIAFPSSHLARRPPSVPSQQRVPIATPLLEADPLEPRRAPDARLTRATTTSSVQSAWSRHQSAAPSRRTSSSSVGRPLPPSRSGCRRSKT